MKTILSEKLELYLHQEGTQELETELRKICVGLEVNVKKIAMTDDGWASVEYEGEDSEVLTEILGREYGVAPVHSSKLKLGDIYRGFVVDSGRVGYGLYLDIGIFSPFKRDGLYPLHRMRSQLVDGNIQSLGQITRRFCLHDGLPLNVRIEDLDGSGRITLALTDRQDSHFRDWERCPFDRVVVIGSSLSRVSGTIRRSGLDKDVIKTDRTSLVSNILTCKLGTEAPGVVAKLGPRLGKVKLYPFIPRVRADSR
ncbi:MAG: DUF2110 family protein [Candidatus Bathyarchaeota archaeon]|jgi:hypothetical protein|nr:DUF2110 family protein [Candidatus Bathyarchaeota archaeon]